MRILSDNLLAKRLQYQVLKDLRLGYQTSILRQKVGFNAVLKSMLVEA